MSKTLYHFTCSHQIEGVKKDGLTLGKIPLSQIHFKEHYQWLTSNPDWKQSWCENQILLKCDRTEWRLIIEIPDSHKINLLVWIIAGPMLTPVFSILSMFGDPHNWYLYDGDIPKNWFKKIEQKQSSKGGPRPTL